MKRTITFLLVLCLTFSLSACGVSTEDYEALATENAALQEPVESLEAEVETLSSENESLSAKIQTLMDEKTEQVLAEMNDSYEKAWVTTSFGDDSIFFTDNNSYLQCVSGETYELTYDGISKLWNDMLTSVSLLAYMQSTFSDQMSPERICVKFFDPSDTYLLEVTLKKNSDSYVLDAVSCNILYTDQIAPILTKVTSK